MFPDAYNVVSYMTRKGNIYMTYEEYYKELTPVIYQVLTKFKGLKTDKEDLIQEGYILIYEILDKLEKAENYKSFFYTSFKNKLLNIHLEEHKQGLYLQVSNVLFKDGEEFDLFDVYN